MERGFTDPWAARHDHQKVDLAFVVDCTGSMGPYIKQTQNNIRNIVDQISRTAFNVRMALVEYRDHPPQDRSFVTRVHDFTTSIDDMKKWVDGMKASGGGDGPEAVADALDATSKLSFRSDSTKMCVLIADAPPHGLDQDGDGFPNGCPLDLDPVAICWKLAEKGITLYFVGCETSVLRYKEFYTGLALITGGQYVPLQNAQALSKVVTNGTQEEVSLEKLMGYVDDFIQLEVVQKLKKADKEKGKNIRINDLAEELQNRLQLTNTRCQQLQLNEAALDSANDMAKKVSGKKNLAEVRKLFPDMTKKFDYTPSYKTTEFTTAQHVHVSKDQSERLLRKSLARNKIPVTQDEVSGEIIVESDVAMEI